MVPPDKLSNKRRKIKSVQSASYEDGPNGKNGRIEIRFKNRFLYIGTGRIRIYT